MTEFDLEKCFNSLKQLSENNNNSAIITLKTLMKFLHSDKSQTANELSHNLRQAINKLKLIKPFEIEIESVAEIYLRFITLSSSKFDDFMELKNDLFNRSLVYIDKVSKCQKQISIVAEKFITNNSTILIHSYSKTIIDVLYECNLKQKQLNIYITKSSPQNYGNQLYDELKNFKNIKNIKLIYDTMIASIMNYIDLVLVGADGVTENGGIINTIGTYQIAICAKAHNKAFYVLAESYKFIRLYPLTQNDIPDRIRFRNNKKNNDEDDDDDDLNNACVDFTPSNYITLLLTDLGPLTTAAVCDMLVQLYT